MVAKPDQDPKRVAAQMPRELVEQIDDHRFAHRLPSRAAATRQLIEAGLEAKGFPPSKRRS
jgi:hypothetical protein